MILQNILPIIAIFERHWDEAPKQLVNDLLPPLAEEGYDTLCFEVPQNLTSNEIILRFKNTLDVDSDIFLKAEKLLKKRGIRNFEKLSDIGFKNLSHLMHLYVSSQRYLEVAQKIKHLPASLLLQETFSKAADLAIDIKGIDIDDKNYDEIIAGDISKRGIELDKNETYRIKTFSDNLFKLRECRKGVIFVCGALHAENLVAAFKQKNMQNDVFYYFPHSEKRYDDDIDEIKEYLTNETLKNHTYKFINEKCRHSLSSKIIKDIKTKKINNQKEINSNPHSFLTKNFKAGFKFFGKILKK